jgi:hypothetical protein
VPELTLGGAGGACCAHQTVHFNPIELQPGRFRERWQCIECEYEFRPVICEQSAVTPEPEEIARHRRTAEDLVNRLDAGNVCKFSSHSAWRYTVAQIDSALRSAAEGSHEKFDKHTYAVAQFLNELYAIMVDPLFDGEMEVSETMEALKAAALRDREVNAARAEQRAELEQVSLERDMLLGNKNAVHLGAQAAITALRQCAAHEAEQRAARSEDHHAEEWLAEEVQLLRASHDEMSAKLAEQRADTERLDRLSGLVETLKTHRALHFSWSREPEMSLREAIDKARSSE